MTPLLQALTEIVRVNKASRLEVPMQVYDLAQEQLGGPYTVTVGNVELVRSEENVWRVVQTA